MPLVVAAAIFIAGCGGNGGGDEGPLAERYPGEAVFNESYVTDEAHDEIEECGFTDSEEQRRRFVQAPPADATGRKVIESFGEDAESKGTLEILQRDPGIYTVSCKPPTEEPAVDVACGAEAPPKANPQQYARPEEVTRARTDYRAVIHTSCGDIEMDLLEQQAPRNVNNFVFLAQEGFYDGLTFPRVVNNFVIQAGDPNDANGTPPDGPGYTIPDEFPDEGPDYVYGVVAMASTGAPDSAGSQFFIVVQSEGPAGLDPLYSIFGVVEESSFETLEKIATVPTKGGTGADAEEPVANVYIESIEITEA